MELTIDCKARSADAKPNALRQSGQIPAVLYGHNGIESISVTVDAKAAEMLIRDAAVNNSLIQVNIPEHSWSGKALLREVQAHPWKGTIRHLSFFSVGSQASLEVDVPLHFTGIPVGVKQGGGSLDPLITSLQVKCAPGDIPEGIDVDVSNLKVGEGLHVSELSLPAGVIALVEASQLVVTVLAPQGGAVEEEAE
jgi:large subunit ribosomal protein L25